MTGIVSDFEKIIARIKFLKGLTEDADVARLLGFARNTFSKRKLRASIPYNQLRLFAAEEGISFDWLLKGQGHPYLERGPSEGAGVDQETADLLDKARFVLTSDHPIHRESLKANILSFYHAVLTEQQSEERITLLEKTLKEMMAKSGPANPNQGGEPSEEEAM